MIVGLGLSVPAGSVETGGPPAAANQQHRRARALGVAREA